MKLTTFPIMKHIHIWSDFGRLFTMSKTAIDSNIISVSKFSGKDDQACDFRNYVFLRCLRPNETRQTVDVHVK